ncbi:MAG: sigma 54-dependent Fis family transcriptional regulator [Deltaproteobacteria bacterium]|nr:sigma 54-dependent Fis family transcriptional regulator [Deltaproteobacteria bacterium]
MSSVTIATSGGLPTRGGKLVVRSGPAKGTTVDIGIEPVLTGRNASCHLVLQDPKVSSIHGEFVATERGVRVRDLGSRNGTWVGEVRIIEAYLAEKTSIWVGETEILFEPSRPTHLHLPTHETFGPLYGGSARMRAVFDRIDKVAATDLTVLIQGETGTGKELVAQAIHNASRRAKTPFVVIDCGAIVQSLAESALFGHERGAFTGAVAARVSPFVEAEGGTVFLDELGELPMDVQPKLLRALAERRVKAVGGTRYNPIEVRVVCATRRDLALSVNEGGFRSDLYFRVAQVTISLPPLRERTEDIPGLVRHMLSDMGAAQAYRRVPHESLERLMRYDWPGNVRELRNAVAVALALAEDGGPVDVAAHVGGATRSGGPMGVGGALGYHEARRESMERFEHEYFDRLSRECTGNISEMARRSGLERVHVRRHLRKHALVTK